MRSHKLPVFIGIPWYFWTAVFIYVFFFGPLLDIHTFWYWAVNFIFWTAVNKVFSLHSIEIQYIKAINRPTTLLWIYQNFSSISYTILLLPSTSSWATGALYITFSYLSLLPYLLNVSKWPSSWLSEWFDLLGATTLFSTTGFPLRQRITLAVPCNSIACH